MPIYKVKKRKETNRRKVTKLESLDGKTKKKIVEYKKGKKAGTSKTTPLALKKKKKKK